ncbi:LysM peptidoglycan-binding domain-containing protein [Yoonia sp. R2331]|uniref:LysM peptidoglycan-binding domain-containing protein n=1 Tax=Yoonia sp. R2331 TaxID=3237238 RepID=UPI0034E44042
MTDDSSISATTANVLAGLGLTIDVPVADAEIANLSSDVLADIGATTGSPTALSPPKPISALETLVVAALKEGRPDAEIDSLLNEAAVAGQLTVPEILVTADGRVDTAILLQSILSEAQIAAGGDAPAVPEVPTGDGTGVEVRVVQRATETEQYRFYTVSPGDSLGAIAVKFYGNVNKFPLIYDANRSILSSPDQIRVGQRLAIPNLPQA